MLRRFLSTRFAALLVCAGLLAGCQTFAVDGLVPSTATAQLAPEAANAIAGDMVGRLAEQVGPGSTTLQLAPDGSAFGQALEASLRGWGYAVATSQQEDGAGVMQLAYVVDDFEDTVLVRLSTTRLDLTRIYKTSSDGATPVSPLSVIERETRQA